MPDPDPNPDPPPSPPPDPFEGISFPDKFKKDGKPDLKTFVTSYGELENRLGAKDADFRKLIQEDMAKDRPKAAAEYRTPVIEGVKQEDLDAHPMISWWRDEAFAAGLPQAKFEAGVTEYLKRMTPTGPTDDDLKAALGDNFRQRISAVDTWATKQAKTPAELEAFKRVGQDADGIKLMERLAGLAMGDAGGGGADPPSEVTLEKLRDMQRDPRYWDPGRRESSFVKQVEDGYKKLYPERR